MTDYPPPTTPSGKRLLAVMSTVPPQGRTGLAYFVNAIERDAAHDAILAASQRADAALYDLEVGASHPGIRAAYRRAVMSAILDDGILQALQRHGGKVTPPGLRATFGLDEP